jgi:bifunctional non-homologous end joining protein LigD
MNLEKMITHPDKVFWPEEGYTKLDIARFYERVFPRLKPYLDDRLLAMERCPDGMRGECFYQKEKPKGMPPGTPTKAIRHQNRTVNYVAGGSLQTQIALVNLGCIPIHMWASRAHYPHQPDWVVFDVDPISGEFADAAEAGLLVKSALDELDLVSFPKTSGSRGLHVFVPIRLGPDYEEVLPFAKEICERVAAAHPKQVTVEQRIKARKKRVYLDAFRNGFGATVVAPYSIRRREGAPFSKPLAWRDVKPSLVPADFNLGNYEKWLKAPDPWEEFFASRQSLQSARKALSRQTVP